LQSVFEGRTVLAVGVGEGYTSAAAILSGARNVIGLDLQKDLPLKEHRFMDYTPPAVLVVGGEASFKLHESSILSSGDWFDPKISLSICGALPDDTVIIFDIESGDRYSVKDMLIPLQESKFQGTLVLRLSLTRVELGGVAELLSSSQMSYRIIKLKEIVRRYRVLVVVTECQWPMYHQRKIVTLSDPKLMLTGCDYNDLKPLEVRMSDAIFNVVDIPNGLSMDAVMKMLRWMVQEAIGDPISKLTYEGWTTLVHAYISAYFVCKTDLEREVLLERWETDGEVQIPLGPRMLRFAFTRVLGLHLTSTAVRALN